MEPDPDSIPSSKITDFNYPISSPIFLVSGFRCRQALIEDLGIQELRNSNIQNLDRQNTFNP
jgi:hypothetical protein